MFDLVHKHKRILQIVLGLMVIPFAFFGLESYTRSMGGAGTVANVDGQTVTEREFNEELRQQMDRLRSIVGRGADVSSFDTPEARSALLDNLIDRRVVATVATRANLVIGDEQLRELIGAMPAFQVDGRFSKASYEALLQAQNMTPAAFESRLRFDLALSQLSRAVSGSAIHSRTLAARLAALEEQKREIQEAVVPAQPYMAQITLDEAQIKGYYDANLGEFRTPEQVKAEFLVLSADQLASMDPVSEDEIKTAYAARASQYRQEEQRRVSHLLIQVAADAKPADKEAARKKIEALLAELRKSPGKFADLARQHSQDPGSAEKGGDLGLVGQGMLVKSFEDAAFKLKEGEVSDVVETEFGYHLIRVASIVAAKTKPLEDVRAELQKELAKQKGARKFVEAAEAFTNLVYEQSDSLQPAAERFKLQIQRSEWLEKTPSPAAGPLANPKLLAALFASDAIVAKRNTDAVEVAPNVLISARVAEHRPEAQLKYEEVRQSIEARLRRQEAVKLAYKDGAAKLALLKEGKDAGLKWTVPRTISRRNPQGLPPEAQRQVLGVDSAKLPAYAGVELDAGYGLYRVTKVIAADPASEADAKATAARLEGEAGAAQFAAYVASKRAAAKIEINKANLEKKQP